MFRGMADEKQADLCHGAPKRLRVWGHQVPLQARIRSRQNLPEKRLPQPCPFLYHMHSAGQSFSTYFQRQEAYPPEELSQKVFTPRETRLNKSYRTKWKGENQMKVYTLDSETLSPVSTPSHKADRGSGEIEHHRRKTYLWWRFRAA